MIEYDEGSWGVLFLCRCRGSMLFKSSVWAVPAAALAGFLRYKYEDLELRDTISAGGTTAPAFFAVCTLLVGALIAMRGHQAYGQWFTCLSLLQSARRDWLNAFSLLVSACSGDVRQARKIEAFQHQAARTMSLMYACCFANMGLHSSQEWNILDVENFGQDSLEFLQNSGERRELVLQQWLQRLIVEAEATGVLLHKPAMMSQFYRNTNQGFEKIVMARSQGVAPYPLPLAHLVMVMLVLITICMPVLCAATVESVVWASIITYMTIMFLWSLHYSVRALEMLFYNEDSGLPLGKLQQGMNEYLTGLLQMRAAAVPVYNYRRDKEMQLNVTNVNLSETLFIARGGARVTYDVTKPQEEEKLNEPALPQQAFQQASAADLPEDQATAPGVLDAVLFQPPGGSDLPSVERPKGIEVSLDMTSWSRAKPAREGAYRGADISRAQGKQKLEAMIDPAAKELSLVELTMLMETHLSRIASGLETLGGKKAPFPWEL